MSIEREEDGNRICREILEKSNEDFQNTRSGLSSNGQHSPRSTKSNESKDRSYGKVKNSD